MKRFAYFIVSIAAILPASSVRAEDSPTAQTIINAWQAREKKIDSFDIRWWSKRTQPPESPPINAINLRAAFHEIKPQPAGAAQPTGPSIWRYRLLMDKSNRFLFEEFGQDYLPDKEEFIPHHVIEVYDGITVKALYDTGRISHHLNITNLPIELKTRWINWAFPLQLSLMPIRDKVGFLSDTSKLVLDQEADSVENTRVLLLGDEKFTLRIDPAKDFVPLSCTFSSGVVDVHLVYQPHETVGWVPKSWTQRRNASSESATVTRCVINSPIADSDFELDLTGGAVVQNRTANSVSFSILYPDGKQRELTPLEFSKPFEDLLKTEKDPDEAK
jgi:hypothetical protein